jgi:hypothetical protein
MTPRRWRRRRLGAPVLAAVLALGAAGCSDGTGFTVLGMNESESDVIVALKDEYPESVILPARSWATLFVSWGNPSGEVRVFDDACNPMATLPFERAGIVVHIGVGGEVEIREGEVHPPDGVERVPVDHNGGYLLEEASCPA